MSPSRPYSPILQMRIGIKCHVSFGQKKISIGNRQFIFRVPSHKRSMEREINLIIGGREEYHLDMFYFPGLL